MKNSRESRGKNRRGRSDVNTAYSATPQFLLWWMSSNFWNLYSDKKVTIHRADHNDKNKSVFDTIYFKLHIHGDMTNKYNCVSHKYFSTLHTPCRKKRRKYPKWTFYGYSEFWCIWKTMFINLCYIILDFLIFKEKFIPSFHLQYFLLDQSKEAVSFKLTGSAFWLSQQIKTRRINL